MAAGLVATAPGCPIPGYIVLLSPACSSFDQYRDYEERGDDFKAIFRRLVQAGRS
jgi:UDP-N-acetylmuramoylalanine--D-glutamate ligase